MSGDFDASLRLLARLRRMYAWSAAFSSAATAIALVSIVTITCSLIDGDWDARQQLTPQRFVALTLLTGSFVGVGQWIVRRRTPLVDIAVAIDPSGRTAVWVEAFERPRPPSIRKRATLADAVVCCTGHEPEADSLNVRMSRGRSVGTAVVAAILFTFSVLQLPSRTASASGRPSATARPAETVADVSSMRPLASADAVGVRVVDWPKQTVTPDATIEFEVAAFSRLGPVAVVVEFRCDGRSLQRLSVPKPAADTRTTRVRLAADLRPWTVRPGSRIAAVIEVRNDGDGEPLSRVERKLKIISRRDLADEAIGDVEAILRMWSVDAEDPRRDLRRVVARLETNRVDVSFLSRALADGERDATLSRLDSAESVLETWLAAARLRQRLASIGSAVADVEAAELGVDSLASVTKVRHEYEVAYAELAGKGQRSIEARTSSFEMRERLRRLHSAGLGEAISNWEASVASNADEAVGATSRNLRGIVSQLLDEPIRSFEPEAIAHAASSVERAIEFADETEAVFAVERDSSDEDRFDAWRQRLTNLRLRVASAAAMYRDIGANPIADRIAGVDLRLRRAGLAARLGQIEDAQRDFQSAADELRLLRSQLTRPAAGGGGRSASVASEGSASGSVFGKGAPEGEADGVATTDESIRMTRSPSGAEAAALRVIEPSDSPGETSPVPDLSQFAPADRAVLREYFERLAIEAEMLPPDDDRGTP